MEHDWIGISFPRTFFGVCRCWVESLGILAGSECTDWLTDWLTDCVVQAAYSCHSYRGGNFLSLLRIGLVNEEKGAKMCSSVCNGYESDARLFRRPYRARLIGLSLVTDHAAWCSWYEWLCICIWIHVAAIISAEKESTSEEWSD